MKIVSRKLLFICSVLAISCCLHNSSLAQTPADDPGGPGSGSGGGTPSGDGSPIVPFDGGMSLVLLVGGVGYMANRVKARSGQLLINSN